MRKCVISYANTKSADQPAHPRSLISAFIARCLDSIIFLDCIAEISRLASFCGCAGRFVSGLVGNSRRHVLSCRGSNAEEEEADILVNRLATTTTRYKMETGPDKTTVMTNNTNGFQREIKIKGQRLETVENFKYLGSIIGKIENGGKVFFQRDLWCPDDRQG